MDVATYEVVRVSGCGWRVKGRRVCVGDRLEQFGGPDGARRVWNVYEVDSVIGRRGPVSSKWAVRMTGMRSGCTSRTIEVSP